MGTSMAMTITVANLGVATMILPTPMITGANVGDFTLTSVPAKACGWTLAAGAPIA